MTRRALATILAFLVLSGPAPAQIASADMTGLLTADWEAVTKCANRPYPAYSGRLQRIAEGYFRQINWCRGALSARHAGWLAAGGKPEADPYPPLPLARDDDFKTELVCDEDDYTGKSLTLRCNVDDPMVAK
jgi:hypothetical protein